MKSSSFSLSAYAAYTEITGTGLKRLHPREATWTTHSTHTARHHAFHAAHHLGHTAL
ncbi:MAG: hypothetical protein QNK43_17495 [Amphritea sp.]|nr:hypothetical protein [Amphritea sp.]